ncbi:MFS transporter [Streptomyces sp. NPDC090025]|uniref:MFS transporter n=1 Tax=Streptomyces sp. NPDC090025 TaxID=3365922 RepID=UPI003833FE8B
MTAADPSHIGPYRLIGRLGAGGMGLVYLGRSEAGRTVAVKVVQAEYAGNAEFRRRFAREVAAARRVGGEWTAAVLDADPEAEVPWVATQYIPGPDLHTVVARDYGPLPEHSVTALANRLALALRTVHDAGLIHRDLKPSNVLVTVDGPRVIDFGIARAMESLAGDSLHTRTGMLIGSPGFMSPEQVRGRELTPASDVFCLGAVLVYAATGRMLFGAGDSGLNAHLFRVAEEEPDLTGVPAPLVELVRACLDKDPARRPTPQQIAERTATDHPDEWLPGSVLAQLGRHAAGLLDFAPPLPAAAAMPPAPTVPPVVPAQHDPRVALAYAPTAGAAPYAPTAPSVSPAGAPGGGRRRGAVLIAVLVLLMVAVEASVFAGTYQDLRVSLDLGSEEVLLAFRVYLVGFAAALPLAGHLVDRIGNRAALLAGLSGFLSVTLLECVLAADVFGEGATLGVLVAARGIMGVTAALLTAGAFALITRGVPDPGARRRAFVGFAAVVVGGSAVGRLLTGAVEEGLNWRIGLYLMVPFAVTLVAMTLGKVERRAPAEGPGTPFDAAAVLLGGAGLGALAYGGAVLDPFDEPEPVSAVVTVAGLLLCAAFGWRQRAVWQALAGPGILGGRRRAGSFLALGLFTAALFDLSWASDFQPVVYHELGPTAQGGVMLSLLVGALAGAAVAGRRAAGAAGTRSCVVWGGILLAAGAAVLPLRLDAGGVFAVVAALAVGGFGAGLALAPLYADLADDAPAGFVGGVGALAAAATQAGESVNSGLMSSTAAPDLIAVVGLAAALLAALVAGTLLRPRRVTP